MKHGRQAVLRFLDKHPAGKAARAPGACKCWVAPAIAILCLHCWKATALSAEVVLLVERGSSIYGQTAQSFRRGLSQAGDLKQVELDESGRLPRDLVKAWRRNPPRLLVAIGTRAARTASERLHGLPILYCLTLRPAEEQLAGSNIGGIVLDPELPQQFESIRRVLPNIHRISVVYDDMTSGLVVKRAREYLGPRIQINSRNARTPREAEQEIRDLFSNVLAPGDAFWLLWDPVVANPANFRTLVELSLKARVPLIVPARPFVEAGALISVSANYEEAGRQLAQMAELILAGRARPGDFRAVAASQLTVTINGEVARKLGVAIPLDLRADVLTPMGTAGRP